MLGPTLFNIFMNDLAYAIKQCRIVNYADDTNIYYSGKGVRAVQNNLRIDLENATSWFIQNGMKPNPDEYQAMVLGQTEDKLNFKLADVDIKITEKTCLLGVVLDNELKFDDHISSICRKVSAQISALNRLKNILPLKGAMSHTAHVRDEALQLENVRQLFQVRWVIQYQEFIVIYRSHPLTVRIVICQLLLYSPFRRFPCVFVSMTLMNGLFEVNCLEVTNVLWRLPITKRPQENLS